jgi:hypothetical protein
MDFKRYQHGDLRDDLEKVISVMVKALDAPGAEEAGDIIWRAMFMLDDILRKLSAFADEDTQPIALDDIPF